MMVRRRMNRMHFMACMHVVVPRVSDNLRRTRSLTFRAQHGRRHRTPDGKQHGQQDQDEDAEVFHVRRLSDRPSVRAGSQKFLSHGHLPQPAISPFLAGPHQTSDSAAPISNTTAAAQNGTAGATVNNEPAPMDPSACPRLPAAAC